MVILPIYKNVTIGYNITVGYKSTAYVGVKRCMSDKTIKSMNSEVVKILGSLPSK